MSLKGDYESLVVYDERKRYYLMQYQRNKPVLDSELRHMDKARMDILRRVIQSFMGDVASPLETHSSPLSYANKAFKVVQANDAEFGLSGTTINNFAVVGGDGTLDNPGVLYYKGIYVFFKGSVLYRDQNDTGSLTDDSYTKTPIPSLTTPMASDRKDVVYLDISFDEAGSADGVTYQDDELKSETIGSDTSNRLRAVFDIRVFENWTDPTDKSIFDNGFFGFVPGQVEHFKVPIAIINRPFNNSNILNANITDLLDRDEKRVLTLKEITWNFRHGGPLDGAQLWDSPGQNQGIGQQALNDDAVTPRSLQDIGKFKQGSLVVGETGASSSVTHNPNHLVLGEVVSDRSYVNSVVAGFDPGIGLTGMRGTPDRMVADMHGLPAGSAGVSIKGYGDFGVKVARYENVSTDEVLWSVDNRGWMAVGKGNADDALDVDGTGRFSTNLFVNNFFSAASVQVGVGGITTDGSLFVDQSATVGQDLFVGGKLDVVGEVTFTGNLNVNGFLGVSVLNDISAATGNFIGLNVSGGASISNGLIVPTGDVTLGSISEDVDLTVFGNGLFLNILSAGGGLSVGGIAAFTDIVFMIDTLAIANLSGQAIFVTAGDVQFNHDLIVNSTTTTQGLVVTGGSVHFPDSGGPDNFYLSRGINGGMLLEGDDKDGTFGIEITSGGPKITMEQIVYGDRVIDFTKDLFGTGYIDFLGNVVVGGYLKVGPGFSVDNFDGNGLQLFFTNHSSPNSEHLGFHFGIPAGNVSVVSSMPLHIMSVSNKFYFNTYASGTAAVGIAEALDTNEPDLGGNQLSVLGFIRSGTGAPVLGNRTGLAWKVFTGTMASGTPGITVISTGLPDGCRIESVTILVRDGQAVWYSLPITLDIAKTPTYFYVDDGIQSIVIQNHPGTWMGDMPELFFRAIVFYSNQPVPVF